MRHPCSSRSILIVSVHGKFVWVSINNHLHAIQGSIAHNCNTLILTIVIRTPKNVDISIGS